MKELQLFNRQRTRALNLPLLRRITRTLLNDLLGQASFELAVHIIDAREMAPLNEQFLQHSGSTDVVTFDYADVPARPESVPPHLNGEIFISIDDAIEYARQFRTTWQSELVRYIVHGILHLRGFDDLSPEPRRVMKRQESLLLKKLSAQFELSQLEKRAPGPAKAARVAKRK